MRKTYNAEFIENAPFLQALHDELGNQEASASLGLTDVSKMLREKKIRPAYEMAAQYIMGPEMKVRSYVVKLDPENAPVILSLLDKLNIQYMSLDF